MSEKPITYQEWHDQGKALFGDNMLEWRFVCPVCKHVTKVQDWKDARATEAAVAFSCIGRWLEESRDAFGKGDGVGPCNYAGGGLFKLNPIRVLDLEGKEGSLFEFDAV